MKINGKKTHSVCIAIIIVNTVLFILKAISFEFYLGSVEACFVVMAMRSATKKTESKLQELREKGLQVEQTVSRFI